MLSLKLISVFTILITLVICGRGKYKYKYNHPTQSDIYVSIPVSVVYENGNRMDKSIDSIVSSSSKPESTTNLVTEESSNEHTINVQKYTTKELITSTSSEYSTTELITSSSFEYMTIFNNYNESHSVDNATKQKESSITPNLETKVEKHIYDQIGKRTFEDENKYSIPVAVIYDPEPETLEKSAIETKMRQKKDHIDTSNEEKVRGSLNIKLQEEKKNIPLEITDSKPNKRVRERNPVTPIIRSENYVYSHSGDFHYSYEGGDGTKAFMSGELRTVDDNAGEAVSGSYSYIGKDGKDYSISYTADENGYRPVGDHLPTPPPIPPAIARALKYLATKSTIEPIMVALK